MSITLYSGLPGSGKSFTVVKDVIIPAIKSGRTVYTNIPLVDDLFVTEFGSCPVHFDTQDVIDNTSWFLDVLPAGAVIVLDEAWRLWPSGLKTNAVNPAHKEFLAEHRHRVGEDGKSMEVVLVTQDANQLAAFVRQLIEKTYRAKKLDTVGQSNRFRLDIYEGAVGGANPPLSNRVREMFGSYDPQVYRFYKSATKSQTGEVGDEAKTDARANVMKGGKIKAIFAAMIFLPIIAALLAWVTYHRLNKQLDKRPDGAAVASAQPVDNKAAIELAKLRSEQSKSFLHGRSISITGIANYGFGDEYRFKVADGDSVAHFSKGDLVRLGYTVAPIGDCIVRISGFSETLYAMCRGEKTAGVIAQAFEAPKDSTQL